MANQLVFTILGIDKGSPAFDSVSKAADKAKVKLDGFGSAGTKALGAMPIAAMAAGVGTVGAIGLISAAMVAMSAVLVGDSEDVANAWGHLGSTITTEAKDAAQVMRGDLVDSANQLRNTVDDLTPQIIQLFEATDKADVVASLTRSVDGLARNAMPGLITAVKASPPVLQGMESAAKDTGRGLTEFFTNAAQGAESSGQAMASTGRIVRDLMGFSGALFAQLANSGSPAVRAMESTLRQLEATVLALGSGAFPVMTDGAAGFLAAGTGMLRLLQLIAPVIGPLTGQILTFATTLKLVDMVSFGAVSTGIGAVKTAVKDADTTGGKWKAGLGALATGPVPLLGIAAAGLSLILQGLGKQEREAAEAAALHDRIVRGLIGTLDTASGAITDKTRKEIAGKVATENVGKANKTLAETAKHMGINTEYVNAAILNQNNELKSLDGGLRTSVKSTILASGSQRDLEILMAKTGKTVDELATIYMGGAGGVDAFQRKLAATDASAHDGSTTLQDLGLKMQGATLDARNLWGGVTELHNGLSDAQKQALQAAQGIGGMTQSQREAAQAAALLAGDFQTVADTMKSVTERASSVIDILDAITGRQPDLRETTQAWNDLMRSLTKDTDWDSTHDGVQKLNKGLVDMRGEVNTATEAGSKLADWALRSQTEFSNSAIAMKNSGMSADEMSTKLGVMRQSFIDNAVAQGLPREAAERLAGAYHLVPGEVLTAILAPGLLQRMSELGNLRGQIVSLPDGRFTVIGETDNARGNITKLVTDFQGKVITLRVTTTGASAGLIRNAAGGMPLFASGTDFAPGGMAVVGEEGPEVVELPRGSKVHDAWKSRQMMSGSGSQLVAGGNTYILQIYNAANTEISLREQFRRMELMDAP